MATARIYDLMYRWWAPWDGVGVREDLRQLLDSNRVDPVRFPRAVDLGCGTGANVVHLAERGYDATGIDFSEVALGRAAERAHDHGVEDRCRFIRADLTDVAASASYGGPYDLLVDFGTLDDLSTAGRQGMAAVAAHLSRPGSLFLLWCFYAPKRELPRVSFNGPSQLAPALEPGEPEALFRSWFDLEPWHVQRDGRPVACFLLTRRGGA